MVKPGPDSALRTRCISMRAHVVHDLVNANLPSVQYVASQDNAAYALTKGLAATTHREARLLCPQEQEQ
eukprot:3117994-Prorocentrum_lima.AAC.1